MDKTHGYTVVTLPVAIVKQPRLLYMLTIFESRAVGAMGASSIHRTHTLVKLDLTRLAKMVEKINARMSELVLEGESVDKLADRLLINLQQISNRTDGSAEVSTLTGSRLEALIQLGQKVATTGRVGQYATEDEVNAVDVAIHAGAGAGAVMGSTGTAALIGSTTTAGVEIGLGTFIAGASVSGLALGGIAVIGAFAGGYLIGTAMYEGAGLVSDTVSEWLSGDEDAVDPVSLVDGGSSDGGSSDGGSSDGGSSDGGSSDGGSSDGGSSDGGSSDSGSSDSDSSDSDSSDSGSSDSGSSDSGSSDSGSDNSNSDDSNSATTSTDDDSTPTPDGESTANGALLLFLATGLGAQQVEQQRRAIEITRGGAYGAPDRTGVNIFDLEPHLAAVYLKLLTRQVETKQNQYGAKIQSFSTGPINYGALTNFGLVDPGPIDVIFFGETPKSFKFRRSLR